MDIIPCKKLILLSQRIAIKYPNLGYKFFKVNNFNFNYGFKYGM